MDKKRKQQYLIVGIIIASILIIDQIVKILVKTRMFMGEDIPLIGEWCRLHFVENEGFAFGMAIGGKVGKIVLTLFRFFASGAILWYLLRSIKKGMRTSLTICLSLIFVGAVGNLIDSCFYGIIFNESCYNLAQLFPTEGGYAPFLQGRVVDMFYFPIIDTTWPDWMPIWGGKPLVFFNAIFNVADAAITVGAIWLIIDQMFLANRNSGDTEDPKAEKSQTSAQPEATNA